MIFRRAMQNGARRLDLKSERAFILHPPEKGSRFLDILPGLMSAVAANDIPLDQAGWENVKLDAWERHLPIATPA